MEAIITSWQFIEKGMECNVIGSAKKQTALQNSYITKAMLTTALEMIEIAEKKYDGIIMCKKPEELVNSKESITVGFCIMFESMEVNRKFITNFKK